MIFEVGNMGGQDAAGSRLLKKADPGRRGLLIRALAGSATGAVLQVAVFPRRRIWGVVGG